MRVRHSLRRLSVLLRNSIPYPWNQLLATGQTGRSRRSIGKKTAALFSILFDKFLYFSMPKIEANLLSNTNAEVWTYLTLVCLLGGPHRAEEAERSLFQALRLGKPNNLDVAVVSCRE